MSAVAPRADHAFPDEQLQAVGQDVGRDTLGRLYELRVSALAAHHVADHEQRPAIAEHVERAGHRAARAPGAGRHDRKSTYVTCKLQVTTHSMRHVSRGVRL